MVEINENLEKDEVGSLGFLLRDYAPRMKMAKDKVCFPQFWHSPLQQRDITVKKYAAWQQRKGVSTARSIEAGVHKHQEADEELWLLFNFVDF